MRNALSTYQKWTKISRQIRTYVIASVFFAVLLFSGSGHLTDTAVGCLILTPLLAYNGMQRTIQSVLLVRSKIQARPLGLLFGRITLLETVFIVGAAVVAPHLGQWGYLFPLMLWISGMLQFQKWTDRAVEKLDKIDLLEAPDRQVIEHRYPTGEGIGM